MTTSNESRDVTQLTSREKALIAAKAAAEKKAGELVVLEVAELIGITDYFVICSGSNERQVATIIDEVTKELKGHGVKPYRIEGHRDRRWALIDYLDLVVHVFHEEERDFYGLERLWQDAPRLVLEEDSEHGDLEAKASGGD